MMIDFTSISSGCLLGRDLASEVALGHLSVARLARIRLQALVGCGELDQSSFSVSLLSPVLLQLPSSVQVEEAQH